MISDDKASHLSHLILGTLKKSALCRLKEDDGKVLREIDLMGRLGELHCAVEVCGKLADLTNQPGFDVESPSGKRISVKTTAQVSGFVSISANTLQKADELMLVQYLNGQTKTVFHGSVQKAVTGTRMWEGRYELDIGRARKLSALPD